MTLPSFDLSGRTALVTGASSGLGEHFAVVLAEAGARVALAARRLERLEALAERIAGRGDHAVPVSMDVTDAASVGAGFDAVERSLGTVDVLVNNSGVATTTRLVELEERDWDTVLDTNLKGAWLVSREAARRMMDAGTAGSIVNVASITALRVAGGLGHYAASKAGVMRLTEALALELARHRIRVNAIAPGYVTTEMNRDFFASEAGRKVIERIPQRRIGEPSDLDGVLLLLASDASGYMTGSTVAVDGGHLVSPL